MSARLKPKYMQTRYRVEFLAGMRPGRYCVIDPDGQRVGQPTSLEGAEARAERLQAADDARAKRGLRPCLCCGTPFESEGIHNRMCDPCRGLDDPMPMASYQGSSSDGRKSRRSTGA